MDGEEKVGKLSLLRVNGGGGGFRKKKRVNREFFSLNEFRQQTKEETC